MAHANVKDANRELAQLKNAMPNCEQFHEHTRSYLKTINETRDLLELDAVLNVVVSKLRAGDNSVSVIKQKYLLVAVPGLKPVVSMVRYFMARLMGA